MKISKDMYAFTLAEILITLSIIGVVSALTIHILHENYQKKVFVTKAYWFYSMMNQALRKSQIDNGPMKYWSIENNDTDISVQYFNQYIKNYLNYSEIKKCPKTNEASGQVFNNYCIFLQNGTVFWLRAMMNGTYADCGFYADYYKGRAANNYLLFMIKDGKLSTYANDWDGTRESLLNGGEYACKNNAPYLAYCSKLIELDGWKISDDYPWKAKASIK